MPATIAEMIPIAELVIAKASVLDQRFKPDPDSLELMVTAWAEVFSLKGMWRAEALEAVSRHYAESRFPITIADVVERVHAMPPTSSPEHLRDWLRKWSKFPNSTAIQELSGMDWRPPDMPSGSPGDASYDAVVAYRRKQFQQWIADNYDTIERAILTRAGGGGIPAIDR